MSLPVFSHESVARDSRLAWLLVWGLTGLSALSVLQATAVPPPAAGRAPIVVPTEAAVKVTTTHEGGATQFFVQNDEFCEVTMTFEMAMVNLKGNAQFPLTVTVPPRSRNEAFEVEPVTPGARWEYSYTNYYKLGSSSAQHDDNYVYQLPYAPGEKFKVTQAYNGKFSHSGSNQYAIDWDLPEGTLVRAARGGIVVRTKDDSDKGGASIEFDRYNNYVLIRHDDGTLGHYCHLQKGGVLVKVGQTVAAGAVIAHSGNTGFSSGPHLHFCVFKARDGRSRVSIPIRFRTAQERAITLASGHSYRAPEFQSASARLSSSNL
jgi:murein DD-endopeptidase MepM/ murein hydrolase activator NlpD